MGSRRSAGWTIHRVFLPMLLTILMVLLAACEGALWNNPYPASSSDDNTLYSSFSERPKHLDPARSYSANENLFLAQIYEPPLQYHYLKRPYTLVPLTTTSVPKPRYYDEHDQLVVGDDANIAYSVYEINIKSGILYQPHPALAVDDDERYRYHDLDITDLDNIHQLADFAQMGTRELTAADYVYQIKRLAHPDRHSPILGLMSEYIVGLKDLAQTIRSQQAAGKVDLRTLSLDGVKVIDRYTYQIKVKGKYPQFVYWLAMPFFTAMPWEVEVFYEQDGMRERNITLDWYPLGSGPYYLTVNNPNRQMVMARNPNFHGESYPESGEPADVDNGLLRDAGKAMPFIDKMIFSLEKENIPYWNKFLQGYYDASGISSDSFDQSINISSTGDIGLTEAMQDKGIRLSTAVETSIFYLGFNMLDPVVGGYSEAQKKLRQAISIAVDYEENISIFSNGRGVAAQGPIPPGIYGAIEGEAGINTRVYDWVNGAPRRKSIEVARALLREAGYPNGVNSKTGQPLVINLDITATGPGAKARLSWYRKQLEKIDLQLVIRNTDWNRFQGKMDNGSAQLFFMGWNADYPDPENFLFLLYGPNGKVKYQGANAANYASPEFDALFEQMKNMDNGERRAAIISEMVDLVRDDSPWVFGFHPKRFSLRHAWYHNSKPNLMANNTLKYKRVDPALRQQSRAAWNQPVVWPMFLIVALVLALLLPAVVMYRRRERAVPGAKDSQRGMN